MHFLQVVSVLLSLTATLVSAVPNLETGDFKTEAKQLVSGIRDLSAKSKNGLSVKSIAAGALLLRDEAASLIQELEGEVSGCGTDVVTKTAAAGIGSHEVITLLLANSEMDVLNGRMSLSLVFLERVAQQLEDELSLTGEVGSQLAAVVFAANATVNIAASADSAAQEIVSGNDVTRRDAGRHLGNAWSVGTAGDLKWRSSKGKTVLYLPRVQAKRQSKRQWSANAGGYYNGNGDWGVKGGVSYSW